MQITDLWAEHVRPLSSIEGSMLGQVKSPFNVPIHLLIWGVFLCSPLSLQAHGPAPSVLDALGDASGGISAVRTNIGLAIPRESGGFRYICPAQWDEEERFPPVSRLTDGRLVLATEGRCTTEMAVP